jgi:hypothetical protein
VKKGSGDQHCHICVFDSADNPAHAGDTVRVIHAMGTCTSQHALGILEDLFMWGEHISGFLKQLVRWKKGKRYWNMSCSGQKKEVCRLPGSHRVRGKDHSRRIRIL